MLGLSMHRTLWLSCTLIACATPGSGSDEQAITNGSPATGDPAVAAIVDDTGTVACTATAIAPHTAITAAHCFVNRDPRKLRLMFGATTAQPTTTTTVSDARFLSGFDPQTLAHDVAILTFRAEVAEPVALDAQPIDASLVGTAVRVVGFGVTT